ncbi:MAG: TatD family hydrolase, partial [Minisyncoccia bacterium]
MSELQYLDAHCHVQFEPYDADRDVLLAQMRERGVGGIVVGCDFSSSNKAVELAEKHEHLWASVGLHPNDNSKEIFDADKYRELAKTAKVVAIGEC